MLLAVGVATCADAPSAARQPVPSVAGARVAFEPVFSRAAAAVYAQRATFAAANFDHVRIVLVRPPTDTVKDTTIVFTPASAIVTLDLTVSARASDETFDGSIDYMNSGAVVFHGASKVQAHALDAPPPSGQQITIAYVGPGATATRLVVAPKTITVTAPGTATFSATAFDANNAGVPTPLAWTSSDPTIATVGASTGVLATTGKRGAVTITATTVTGLSDNGGATITLPPAAIALVSGGGQTGKAGSALAQSATVRVTATDGVGVSGVNVNFGAPVGGSVGAPSATTDASGQASTSLTLGPTAGPQGFAATAAGFSASIPATATPADPKVVVAVSGGGQSDTVKHALRSPFIVKVTDAFGNAVSGVAVTWTRTSGTGSVGAAATSTDAAGTASIGYTLGASAGAEAVTASIAAGGSASFMAVALPNGPSSIAATSGGGQAGRVSTPLSAPFVVSVTDAAGNPVSGVSVSWTATNGTLAPTTTSDANGLSSNTLTLGATVGSASATASIGAGSTAKSVTFAATVQPGIVAKQVFRVSPTGGASGLVLVPAIEVELQDAAGNRTVATNTVTIALGANPGTATLTGTLTRAAVNGVATFDDLLLSAPGVGYTLVATSGGIPSATSPSFTITGTPRPSVIIASINTVVCNPTCASIPLNLSAAQGQIDVTVGVSANGAPLQDVSVALSCPGSTGLNAVQTVSGTPPGTVPVTLSLPTTQFDVVTGVPKVRNGACTIAAAATGAGGGSVIKTVGLTLTNSDGVVMSSSFAPLTNAEGVLQLPTVNDAQGMPWHSGAVSVQALPVLYSGKTIASATITLPGATNPSVSVAAAPYVVTWSATATTGPRVTGLTLVDATGCVGPAAPPVCGALESNGITPKGVTPTFTALDAVGATIPLVVLNPNTTASTFRVDNTPPQAPLAFNIHAASIGWVGPSYVFASVGPGTNNLDVTIGSENYISCGDGPDVPANPYFCVAQIGVSASANGQVGVPGIQASNGKTTFSYYAIPAASYTPVSTTNGTSTSAAACSTAGWTKITSPAALSATVSNTVYTVRLFETDLLGNARCTDLAIPPTLATVGKIINTGVAGTFGAANQGRFGVDKGAPSIAFIEPTSDATAAGANQFVVIGSAPFFKFALSDDASGFPAKPIETSLRRLAIDPTTNLPSTATSAFGCPIGRQPSGCTAASQLMPAVIVVDAADSLNSSSNIDGYYTITAIGADLAQNESPTLTRTVLIDRAAPVVGSVTVPATLTGGASASFAVTATDNLDLIQSIYRLSYAANPSGNPGSGFLINAAGPTLGVAFDNVLTTSASFNVVVPSFMRTLATTTGAGAPQNNGASGLPSSVSVQAVDGANHFGAFNTAAIPPAALSLAGLTDYTLTQPSGASFTSLLVTNAATNISNCLPSGCVGGAPPANPTVVTLTAAAAGTANGSFQFANPFSRVDFYYYLPNSAIWIPVGSVTAPAVTDDAPLTTRTFTWTLTTPLDPPSALGSGTTLKIVAVGVNALGDALMSPVNTNIALTNP